MSAKPSRLVERVKAAAAPASSVANPMLLAKAIEQFEESRPSLNHNRSSTAAEKRRTMDLLQAHLIARGRPADKTEVRRDELVDFVSDYAQRPAKASAEAAPLTPSTGRPKACARTLPAPSAAKATQVLPTLNCRRSSSRLATSPISELPTSSGRP